MFTLLTGLWRYYFKPDEFYVLVLGLDNAGKTTFLEHSRAAFANKSAFRKTPDSDLKIAKDLTRITSTVGLNVGAIHTKGVKLSFWDLGGQAELRTLWDAYFAESHAIVFIVDATEKPRLPECKLAFDSVISNSLLAGIPLLIIANKQDVEDCLTVDDVREEFHCFTSKIGHRDCHMIGASALKGTNLEDAIEWLAEKVKLNIRNKPPKSDDDGG